MHTFPAHSNYVEFFSTAMKEERYRYGSGFDQMEDVMGVAQPVRFNSKFFAVNRSVFSPQFTGVHKQNQCH